jgi:hypothetical protein
MLKVLNKCSFLKLEECLDIAFYHSNVVYVFGAGCHFIVCVCIAVSPSFHAVAHIGME